MSFPAIAIWFMMYAIHGIGMTASFVRKLPTCSTALAASLPSDESSPSVGVAPLGQLLFGLSLLNFDFYDALHLRFA